MSLTWDAAHKGASCTLSSANSRANCHNGAGARGTIAHSATDVNGFYFEVTGVSSSDGFSSHFFGLANATWDPSDGATTAHTLGYDANGWAVSTNRNSYPTQPFNNGVMSGADIHALPLNNFGSDFIGPATIGVLLKGGKMTLYGTGAYAGVVVDAFTGLTGSFYPAVACYPASVRDVLIAVNGGDSAFAGTKPVGANNWSITTPVAAFTSSVSSGANALAVTFTDTSTNTPTSWLWDFGDGTTSTSQNPSHTFSTGAWTVTLTATNAGGSSQVTHPITVTAVTATRGDWRCQGAKYAAIHGSKVAISSPQTRSVVIADAGTDRNLWADTGALAAAPGALVYGSTLWTVCADGYVRKLNTTTAALIASVNTYASTTAWLAINAEGVVIAPGANGKVATISGTTVVDTIPVLPRVDAAVYTTGRYLYCFGPGGTGAVVTVSAAGALSKIGTFDATHCRDIRRAKLMPDGKLVVACKSWVVEFSLTDPTTPAVTLSTAYATEVFSVADDNAHTAITAATRLGGEVPIYDATLNGSDYILVGPTPYVRVTS